MLASDVINRARVILRDENTPYRWSDVSLLLWLNDGQREIVLERPDALFDSDADLKTLTEATATTDELTLEDSWRTPLMDYICFMAFQQDSDDTANQQRATSHYQLFQQGIVR